MILTTNLFHSTMGISWTVDSTLYKKLLLVTKYRQELCIGSPAYLQIFDSDNNMTGFNGVGVTDQIPNIVYDFEKHEAASIIVPIGTYRYRIIGTETGTYKFAAIDINNGGERVLRVMNAPIIKGEVHEYSVDWTRLTSTAGVTVRVDSNGDSNFEKTITSGSILTASQFVKSNTGDGEIKSAICHMPPGNPANSKTLYLPATAIQAHLGHGDKLGECVSVPTSAQQVSSPPGNSGKILPGQAKKKNK